MASIVFDRSLPDPRVAAEALAGSRQAAFWLDDLPGRAEFPRYAGTGAFETAVIGGGYTGLWTALQAKQRNPDARVVLLEAKTIGWAASGRNG
ncbi:MAG: hypothetical protein QOE21_953, partial [Microbacteriaceae bacterium]|nr:hypothetical protein [Microbacteriaceae bacterium]